MEQERIELDAWIRSNTEGCQCVVELGSMFFQKLACVHPDVPKKIGIEIWQPYIERAKYHDCVQIHGDLRKFEDLVDCADMDCCMMIDVLEHFDKATALELVERIKQSFNKFLLFIPEGLHPQTKDAFKLGADKYQTHRSTWLADEIAEELDMSPANITFDPNQHRNKRSKGALFVVWEREKL